MTIIEAIEITRDCAASNWHADDEQRQAMAMVADLLAAYDALAPDWAQAPDGAQWYVISANGQAWWCGFEPTIFEARWIFVSEAIVEAFRFDKSIQLPFGIDWRLCIWQRPEAQP